MNEMKTHGYKLASKGNTLVTFKKIKNKNLTNGKNMDNINRNIAFFYNHFSLLYNDQWLC